MEKKYQVFVSSTYEDLKEERTAVINCLIANNCFPVGMEHFPASDKKPRELIEERLKKCDFYLLVSAGRYGLCENESEEALSYTEMEYDFAKSINIPILAFIIKDFEKLEIGKTDYKIPSNMIKLTKFQDKVKRDNTVNFFTNKDDLAKAVANSIHEKILEIEKISNNSLNSKKRQLEKELVEIKETIKSIPTIKTGTAAPTTATCPVGSLYGQYE